MRSCKTCSKQFRVFPSSLKKGAKWCSLFCMRKWKSDNKITRNKFYTVWVQMKSRCNDPKRSNYKYYGAKGITYDEQWEYFKGFMKDMLLGYKEGLTLDRIDSDKNYYKENCQWISMAEQNRKHRNCVWLEYKGRRMILSDWAREFKIKENTLQKRIREYGWPIEKSLMTPIR